MNSITFTQDTFRVVWEQTFIALDVERKNNTEPVWVGCSVLHVWVD